MPAVGPSPARATPRLLAGTDRKRSRLNRTGQDLWEETGWSHQRWSRAAPSLRGARARSLARGRSEASPENAARERSRVRTLRQAFLALQATLPAVPPDTKLSKLDVLVLATSYIAHLTRMLGHEMPGPAWPPFLRGLRYLHPLKAPTDPLEIPRGQTLLPRDRGRNLGWQQLRVLMGKPGAKQALGSCECEQTSVGVT
ncbi:transcription factor 23 [Camelus ferus]|nr:transcription factor 23 [Camelus ferus]